MEKSCWYEQLLLAGSQSIWGTHEALSHMGGWAMGPIGTAALADKILKYLALKKEWNLQNIHFCGEK